MKSPIQKAHRRDRGAGSSGIAALTPVIALLTAAMLAKLGAVTQFVHLTH